MALWLVRAGKIGEYEDKFLDEGRVYLTWEGLSHDLRIIKDRQALSNLLLKVYPDIKPGTVRNWTGQIWLLAKEKK